MVSPELLRRYQFFAGLSSEQIASLARLADETSVESDHYLFSEGEDLSNLFLLLEGRIATSISLPEIGNREVVPSTSAKKREVTVGLVGVGEIFAWSALVPPYKAITNARALTECRVVEISASDLRALFDLDPRFGYQIILHVAQIAQDRLQELHYESLADAVDHADF
jgi:CRP/FNR family transcriptional regulator, cyclic AMP receptor protein